MCCADPICLNIIEFLHSLGKLQPFNTWENTHPTARLKRPLYTRSRHFGILEQCSFIGFASILAYFDEDQWCLSVIMLESKNGFKFMWGLQMKKSSKRPGKELHDYKIALQGLEHKVENMFQRLLKKSFNHESSPDLFSQYSFWTSLKWILLIKRKKF